MVTKFAIRDTKLWGPFVTLSIQDNAKLLQELISGFNRTINLNKYQSKVTIQAQNKSLDYLIHSIFQEVKRLSALLFEDNVARTAHRKYFLPKVEINDDNSVVDGKNIFDEPLKNYVRIYGNIQKIAGQEDDYETGCLLDHPYFRNIRCSNRSKSITGVC